MVILNNKLSCGRKFEYGRCVSGDLKSKANSFWMSVSGVLLTAMSVKAVKPGNRSPSV